MMTPGYICWKVEPLYRRLNTQADFADDDVFLATHTEFPLARLDTTTRQPSGTMEPRDFVEAFLDPKRASAYAVVQGDSGAGKSHLIHWLKLRIPATRNRVVLSIPRSGTNLRSVLERIIDILPEGQRGTFQDQLEHAPIHSFSVGQRKEQLLSAIANATSAVMDAREATGQRRGPEIRDLFNDPEFRRKLAYPGGVVERLVTHIGQQADEYVPEEEALSFRRDDLSMEGIETDRLAAPTRRVANALLMPARMDECLALVNEALPAAMAAVLNFTGEQLSDLMRQVRRSLKAEGKELVLLIEDLARTQGLDTALIDALIDPSDELCPLRWAMAVTRGYYEKTPNTLQTRVDFLIDVDLRVDLDRDAETLIGFSSRYLNAARLEAHELADWYEAVRREDGATETPNACTNCLEREPCHAAFGQRNGIGLYPITGPGLLNMSERRAVVRNDVFNPRKLIKDVLREVLTRGADIHEMRHPTAALLATFGGAQLPPALRDRLRERDPEHAARQQAVLELYSRRSRTADLIDEAVYAAFGLPAPVVARAAPQPRDGGDGVAPAQPVPVVVERVDPRITALHAWVNDDTAALVQEAAQRFRELVFAAIDEGIDWDAEQLERSHFAPDSWFRRTSINFRRQQTQGPHAKVRLLLPLGEGDERDYALALEGLHRFAREGSWDFDGGGEFLAATQNCVEIWAAEVVRQLKDAKTYSGEAFESVRAAQEVLAIGLILTEMVNFRSSDEDWLSALAKPSLARVPEGTRFAALGKEIGRAEAALRAVARSRTNGTKGGQAGGFIDPGPFLRTLARLRKNAWQPTATVPVVTGNDNYAQVARVHQRVAEQLPTLSEAERSARVEKARHVRELWPEATGRQLKDLAEALRRETTDAGVSYSPAARRLDAALDAFHPNILDDALERAPRMERSENVIFTLARPRDLQALEGGIAVAEALGELIRTSGETVARQISDLGQEGEEQERALASIETDLAALQDLLAGLE